MMPSCQQWPLRALVCMHDPCAMVHQRLYAACLSMVRECWEVSGFACTALSREEDLKDAQKQKPDEEQEAAKSERNDGDEGFVEDYIDHDHNDEERVEMSHPDNLSTSSRDEEAEVGQHVTMLGSGAFVY